MTRASCRPFEACPTLAARIAPLLVLALVAGCGKPQTVVVRKPAAPARLSIPAPFEETRFDFEAWREADWSPAGKWLVREVADAPSGKRVLERKEFDLSGAVLAYDRDEYADVQVSMRFRLLGKGADSEVGIVFRQAAGCYYVAAVEGTGRLGLRGFDGSTMSTSFGGGSMSTSSLQEWRTLKLVAIGDRIQFDLDGDAHVEVEDGRFKKGKVGLWFYGRVPVQVDDLVIRTRAMAVDTFDGLEWNGVTAQARQRFFAWANREPCPCGSGRTLARCRKAGCADALDRGRDVLEQCEGE